MKAQLKQKRIKLLDTGQRNQTTAIVLDKNERMRANAKRWQQNNPDKYKKHLEYVKEWKRNNPDRVMAYNSNWYKKNGKQYYQDNKSTILEHQRQFRRRKSKSKSKC